jgi:hypothetical protein
MEDIPILSQDFVERNNESEGITGFWVTVFGDASQVGDK